MARIPVRSQKSHFGDAAVARGPRQICQATGRHHLCLVKRCPTRSLLVVESAICFSSSDSRVKRLDHLTRHHTEALGRTYNSSHHVVAVVFSEVLLVKRTLLLVVVGSGPWPRASRGGRIST